MDNLILTPVTENFMLIFISFKRILATLCQMKLKNFYYNLGLIFLSSIKHLLPAFLSVFNSLTVIVSLFFYNIRCHETVSVETNEKQMKLLNFYSEFITKMLEYNISIREQF